ncbi:MAG: hypothetical protein NT040_12620 [Bacteroidetes bacterium]|nr:hypothetical protein [Bacteroidota bacterium]
MSNAITITCKPANAKIHQLRGLLETKLSNHLYMAYQATGTAMTNAMAIPLMKLKLSINIISETVAPFALRMPIAFVRLAVIKEAIPDNPMLANKIASMAKYPIK